MHRNTVFLIILLSAAAVCVSGCVLAAVGAGAAGTVAYLRGDLEAMRAERLNAVYDASLQAMQQMEYKIVKSSKDATTGEIVAKDSQDDKITIKLEATAEGPTSISIRVGTFGSERRSRLIYDKIRTNLES